MGDQEKPSYSLMEKYKIKNENEDSKNWARLLDFESPIKVESDWYSTQTFQVFLDALDINQPVNTGAGINPTSNGSNSNLGTNDKTHTTLETTLNNNNDKQSPVANRDQDQNKITENDKQQQNNKNNFETILSAEALKILSDLPDLSHMSATRSFIFPATTTDPTTTTKASQKTKINTAKR
jgi:hypothetical protein